MTTNWWKQLYDENLATILLNPAVGKELENTCTFLTEILNLNNTTSKVFDQCCGNGRIAHALAKQGNTCFGVDQASYYIELATKTSLEAGLKNTYFETADAFYYSPPQNCDAAFNWWTSFGYAPEDAINRQMLIRAYETLKPGGKFALDYMNVPQIYANFKSDVITRQPMQDGSGRVLTLLRESSIDLENDALLKTWTYYLPEGKKITYHSHTRLYTPTQLKQLFKKTGFQNLTLYGDIDQSSLTIKSPRCIIVGQK